MTSVTHHDLSRSQWPWTKFTKHWSEKLILASLYFAKNYFSATSSATADLDFTLKLKWIWLINLITNTVKSWTLVSTATLWKYQILEEIGKPFFYRYINSVGSPVWLCLGGPTRHVSKTSINEKTKWLAEKYNFLSLEIRFPALRNTIPRLQKYKFPSSRNTTVLPLEIQSPGSTILMSLLSKMPKRNLPTERLISKSDISKMIN